MVETTLIESILGYSIGGISLGLILYLAIYVIHFIRKAKKDANLTQATIVDCFKGVVIPKDLRINLSNKIKPVIKQEIANNIEPIVKSYNKLLLQNYLILSILAKFTHAEDLTDEEKALMGELLNDPSISEVDITE